MHQIKKIKIDSWIENYFLFKETQDQIHFRYVGKMIHLITQPSLHLKDRGALSLAAINVVTDCWRRQSYTLGPMSASSYHYQLLHRCLDLVINHGTDHWWTGPLALLWSLHNWYWEDLGHQHVVTRLGPPSPSYHLDLDNHMTSYLIVKISPSLELEGSVILVMILI